MELIESADKARRVVSFGIFLGEDMFRKGIGTEAMTELVNRVMNSRDVDEGYVTVFEENEASLRLFNKVFDKVIGLNPDLKLRKVCEPIQVREGFNLQ